MHSSGDLSCPTEQTPLLNAAASQGAQRSCRSDGCPTPSPHKPSHPWLHHAITIAFVFLTFLLCLAVAIVFTAHSYVTPLLQADPALLAQRSLAFDGPSYINVLNYTSDGLWCEVAGAAAVDARLALGLSDRFPDRMVGWAVRRVGSVTVSAPTTHIYSASGTHLTTLHSPDITLPLATKSPPNLENITLRFLVKPARNSQDLLDFVSRSWQTGFIHLRVDAAKVLVTGGRKAARFSWKHYIRVKRDVHTVFKLAIPPIPGLPPSPPNGPRPVPDLASLVYLQSYHVLPPPPTLRLVGTATLPNLAPSILQGAIALSLPFIVSLPPAGSDTFRLPLARVETAPLVLTTPNISLAISGHVLPLPSSSNSIAPLSKFASDFLAARSSPVLVTTDFLHNLGMQEELTLEAEFPAGAERPELLRDVQISNMRVSLRGEQILASAFVRARIVPPDTLASLRINATRVWPDLLVYDGPVPGLWPFNDPNAGSSNGVQYDERWTEPEPMPLPNPLPPTAFARIRPDSWILAHTEATEDDKGVWVQAKVTDVPLVVLPGRDAELRRFISKVLFNMGGARAGVAGITAVAARVGGLVVGSVESGEMELFGLPLHGETWVGKKSLQESEWNLPAPSIPLPEPSLPAPSIPSMPSPTLPVPHIPHIPHIPDIPNIPDIPHTPHIPHLPDVSDEPIAPVTPPVPDSPCVPNLQCVPVTPSPTPEPPVESPDEYWAMWGGGGGISAEMLETGDQGELWQVGVQY